MNLPCRRRPPRKPKAPFKKPYKKFINVLTYKFFLLTR